MIPTDLRLSGLGSDHLGSENQSRDFAQVLRYPVGLTDIRHTHLRDKEGQMKHRMWEQLFCRLEHHHSPHKRHRRLQRLLFLLSSGGAKTI